MPASACARWPPTWPSATWTPSPTVGRCPWATERSVLAALGRGKRGGVGVLGRPLGLAHWVDGHPASAPHTVVVQLAVLHARGVIATEFVRRVLLVDLQPLPFVIGAAAGSGKSENHGDRKNESTHLRGIVPGVRSKMND